LDVGQQLIFLLEGVPLTLSISLISFLVGIAVGLPLAFIRVYEKEIGFVVDAYEKIFRGIPEIVLMLLVFFGLGPVFPVPFNSALFVACFVLGLRSGANQSQIYRGAIHGVGDEQMIAGQSVGLSKWRSIWHIMIPQVFTYSTPGLGSEYALLIKDSAYVYVIGGLAEVMTRAIQIKTSGTFLYDTATPFIIGAIIYIALTFPIAFWLDRWGTKRKKKIGL
jgi:polar amino acid transport system permease protein